MTRNADQLKKRKLTDKVFENRKLEWFGRKAGASDEGDDDGPAPGKKGKEGEDCD